MSPHPTFILFSGHNDRAVIALCRFFSQQNLKWVVISAGRDDFIHSTDYSKFVIFNRISKVFDKDLLLSIFLAISGPIVFCPTSEFINHFLLENKDFLTTLFVELGGEYNDLDLGLAQGELYSRLTNKGESQFIASKINGLIMPPLLDWDSLEAPCVFKPIVNILKSKVYYPQICLTNESVNNFISQHDKLELENNWFIQKHISGQSYYICAYIARDGRHSHYWQENLLQQEGGKSIILARSCCNPGLNENDFFDILISLGYSGPIMMEIIRDLSGELYFIEFNPRFWGPLQLSQSAAPELLFLFLQDHGVVHIHYPSSLESKVHWYSWGFGAYGNRYHRYPAILSDDLAKDLVKLLELYDVYGHQDSRMLHLKH